MNHQQIPNQVPRTSTMAVISLVAGLLCIPLVSIILGHLARSEINKSKGSVAGKGIALTGLILGYLQLLIGILLLLGSLVVSSLSYSELTEAQYEMESSFSSVEYSEPLNMESSGDLRYYELTGLITNLGGPIKSRYINVELKLEGLAGDFEKVLELNEHRLRNAALHIMGGYTYEEAQLDGFQERVRVDLKKSFSIVLKEYRSGESDIIRHIYFTQFVVQ
jgi:flagellar basal body-associated protein FliL